MEPGHRQPSVRIATVTPDDQFAWLLMAAMDASDERLATAEPQDVLQRELLFGVTSLCRGILIERFLRAAGVDAALDVGQQNWPATIHVGIAATDTPLPREQVRWLVRFVDPRSSQLRFFRRRTESVRLAGARMAAPEPHPRPSLPGKEPTGIATARRGDSSA